MLVAISVIGIVVVAAIVGFAAYSMGIFAADAVDGGPRSVTFWGLVTALSVGAAYSFLGLIAAEMAGLRNPVPFMVLVGGAAAALSLVLPVQALFTTKAERVFLQSMAPRITEFGLANFVVIDRDGDGMLSESDLLAAMGRCSNSDDYVLLSHLLREISLVGHVIDSSSSITYIWVGDGNGCGTMTPMIDTTYTYGISRGDLNGYVARLTKKYSRW